MPRTRRPPAAQATPSRTCHLDCPVHSSHLRQKGLYTPAQGSPSMDQDPVTARLCGSLSAEPHGYLGRERLPAASFQRGAKRVKAKGQRWKGRVVGEAAPAPRKDTRAENHTHGGFLGQSPEAEGCWKQGWAWLSHRAGKRQAGSAKTCQTHSPC